VSRHQSLAVVLRRWPYSESSLVVHCLTPELGLVPMLAKGVHKIKSGHLGVLDTFALVRLNFGSHADREMHTLFRAELVDRFSAISQDVDHLAAAGLLGELAELAAPLGLPSQQVFVHLVESFQELASGAQIPCFLVRRLQESLAHLGLQPDFSPPNSKNSSGHPPVSETDPLSSANADGWWFSVATGTLLPAGSSRPDGSSYRVKPGHLQMLNHPLAADVQANEQELRRASDCLTILADFLGYHLERPPRALSALLQASPTATSTR
jgi:recombinational DNA repair protein (RecF pathway)